MTESTPTLRHKSKRPIMQWLATFFMRRLSEHEQTEVFLRVGDASLGRDDNEDEEIQQLIGEFSRVVEPLESIPMEMGVEVAPGLATYTITECTDVYGEPRSLYVYEGEYQGGVDAEYRFIGTGDIEEVITFIKGIWRELVEHHMDMLNEFSAAVFPYHEEVHGIVTAKTTDVDDGWIARGQYEGMISTFRIKQVTK